MTLFSFSRSDSCSSVFTTLFANKNITKDDLLAYRIPQEKHTFIPVVILQTSESTLHSHRNITDTGTLSWHTGVVIRCPSLGAAGFQDKWIPIFLEKEGLSRLQSKAMANPYLLHTTAMTLAPEVPARMLYTKKTNKWTFSYLVSCNEV